jgi:hypothetical protein
VTLDTFTHVDTTSISKMVHAYVSEESEDISVEAENASPARTVMVFRLPMRQKFTKDTATNLLPS